MTPVKEDTKASLFQLVRYSLTAFSTFLLDYGLLYLLQHLGLYYILAAGISFVTGITCNFILTKYFAFRGIRAPVGKTGEYGTMICISGTGLLLTLALMYLFTDCFGLPVMLSKLIAGFMVFFWNFLGRKLLLYRGKKTSHSGKSVL